MQSEKYKNLQSLLSESDELAKIVAKSILTTKGKERL